jgi:O-antigen biosynthesis protein
LKTEMRYYCTYFDKGYLVRAIALHASLQRHEQSPFTLYAVCLDELTRILVERLRLPGVVAIPLHEIEAADEPLRKARSNRSQVEYYWTLTPTVILHLLKREQQVKVITYLDADLYFFSSPDPIFEEFAGHSVLIHEHRFHEEFKPAIKYGRFNVGLLCFRRDVRAMAVLEWWREQCNEWCYARLEDGKYGDQLYLDCWPDRFEGVRILEHTGAGVAPWNNMQYRYSLDRHGKVMVDDRPMVFYHFHALTFSHPRYVVLSRLASHKFKQSLILHCYLPYIKELHKALLRIWDFSPDFQFGLAGEYISSFAAIVLNAGDIAFNLPQGGDKAPKLAPLDEQYSLLVTDQVTADD